MHCGRHFLHMHTFPCCQRLLIIRRVIICWFMLDFLLDLLLDLMSWLCCWLWSIYMLLELLLLWLCCAWSRLLRLDLHLGFDSCWRGHSSSGYNGRSRLLWLVIATWYDSHIFIRIRHGSTTGHASLRAGGSFVRVVVGAFESKQAAACKVLNALVALLSFWLARR